MNINPGVRLPRQIRVTFVRTGIPADSLLLAQYDACVQLFHHVVKDELKNATECVRLGLGLGLGFRV